MGWLMWWALGSVVFSVGFTVGGLLARSGPSATEAEPIVTSSFRLRPPA